MFTPKPPPIMAIRPGRKTSATCNRWWSLKPTRRLMNWASASCSAAASPNSRGPNGCSRRATTPKTQSIGWPLKAANPNLPSSPFQRDPTNDDELKELKRSFYAGYDNWQKQGQVVTGSPKTVVRKLRHILEVLRPGIFSF